MKTFRAFTESEKLPSGMSSKIPGTRAVASRMVNAGNDFVGVLVGMGYTKDQAEKILAKYIKLKVIKLDAVGGKYSVKHGAFLDKDVLDRALKD